MADTILFQGQGYTIAQSDSAETLVPYGPAEHHDGTQNYGFMDLRGRPDLVACVPEAAKSAGLLDFLKTVADPISRVWSIGCECAVFDKGVEAQPFRWQAGGYINLLFVDNEENKEPQNFVDLARYILGGVNGSAQHVIAYEMIIEPLKLYFGEDGHYSLMIKPVGYSDAEAKARAAFEYAIVAAAQSIARDRPN